jgi:Co/Zn/Cd efflux system component
MRALGTHSLFWSHAACFPALRGLSSGSLALVADSVHMLSDLVCVVTPPSLRLCVAPLIDRAQIALLIGLYAIRASRQGRTDEATFGGWCTHLADARGTSADAAAGGSRFEVVASHMNACFLVALCFSIIIESIGRFISPNGAACGPACAVSDSRRHRGRRGSRNRDSHRR